MPANYVIEYNPANSDKSVAKMDNADKRLATLAAEIASGTQKVKTLPITANNLYKDIEKLDAAFTVSDGCMSCGLCRRICPVRSIQLENGRPEWLHHYERCVTCISWCPARAIEHGGRTHKRRRYRNPRISADELIRREPGE